MKIHYSVPLARVLLRTLFGAVLALPGLVQAAKAQTAFEQLFDPRTATSIILVMTEAKWNLMAQELPTGGTLCDFGADPSVDRYIWHDPDAIVITEWETRREERYKDIGIKKKSFCGSFDKTKPSLTLRLD